MQPPPFGSGVDLGEIKPSGWSDIPKVPSGWSEVKVTGRDNLKIAAQKIYNRLQSVDPIPNPGFF
jgi:hypothetical protein